ncbi:MAG: SAM-dependent methyltransferase [Actinomycetales bacterium]
MPEAFRPWREAWSDALYGSHGFYRRTEGPRGHFETSANALGGETALLAQALARLATANGCRRVVDVGAGRGELMVALAAGPGADLDLLAVDVVPRPAGLADGVGWLESPGGAALPAALDGLEDTLVLAHEWLDVVPCEVLEVDAAGVPRVVEVDRYGVERLGDRADQAVRDAWQWSEQWWPLPYPAPGVRVEVGLSRDAAWAGLLSRVRSGLVVAVDYGHTAEARPAGGTLAAHRAGRLVPPVPDGSCDLTAHVAWDSLLAGCSPARLTTQRAALSELGLDGRRPAADPADPTYLLELQRASAAATLLDPGGLGGLGWLIRPVPPRAAEGPAGIGQPQPPPARLEP